MKQMNSKLCLRTIILGEKNTFKDWTSLEIIISPFFYPWTERSRSPSGNNLQLKFHFRALLITTLESDLEN